MSKINFKYDLDESQRVGKYIAQLDIPELYSRTMIDNLIIDGCIMVNGQNVKKNYLLKPEDLIEITVPQPPDTTIQAENIPLDIVYEDEYLAIINKSAGIIVHPTPGNNSGTIVNAIINKFGSNLAQDDTRPGIVHRLDKNTSGLLIIAKDNKTKFLLNKLFADRKINKYYKAILVGIPKESSGVISASIARSHTDRTKMCVQHTGRSAVTIYSIEETYEYFSLADIKLETGRTHQIRVHFDYINCPVFGDDTYGFKKIKNLIPINFYKKVTFYMERQLKRQALHSYKLQFIHPVTNKELSVEAPPPLDFINCLQWLKSLSNF